jgi:hypothetical protein
VAVTVNGGVQVIRVTDASYQIKWSGGTSGGVTTITSSTPTDLTGILRGDGAHVGTVTVGTGLSYSAGTLSATGTSPGGSSGQVQFNSAGAFGGAAGTVYASTGTHITITSQGASITPLKLKGATSQSANLTEWQNSSGTAQSYMDATGSLTVNSH